VPALKHAMTTSNPPPNLDGFIQVPCALGFMMTSLATRHANTKPKNLSSIQRRDGPTGRVRPRSPPGPSVIGAATAWKTLSAAGMRQGGSRDGAIRSAEEDRASLIDAQGKSSNAS
jgi:hypothetical protein